MYDITMLALAAIAAIAAVVAVLPLLGFDLRIIGRSTASEPAKPTKKAWIALLIAIVSVGLSAGSFYYFARPRTVVRTIEKPVERIVEKPVDRIVEKKVPIPCDKKPIRSKNGATANDQPQQAAPVTLNCDGGNCAATSGQQGGITAGQINIGAVGRKLSPQDMDQIALWSTGITKEISLCVVAGASDGYPLAYQLQEALKKAQVKYDDHISLVSMANGPPLYGVQIDYNGPDQPLGSVVWIDTRTEPGKLYAGLEAGNVVIGAVHPDSHWPEDRIRIVVGFNPADKR